MPVIAPPPPGPTPAGLIWSAASTQASATVTIPCGTWWLIVPDAPQLSIPLRVLGPISSTTPGQIKAPSSHSYSQDIPQTVHEILGDRYPIITKASEAKSESFSLFAAFLNQAEFDAFTAIWEGLYSCLVQSDTTKQWYVDLGKTRKVEEFQSEDPSFVPMEIVSLDCREIGPPV